MNSKAAEDFLKQQVLRNKSPAVQYAFFDKDHIIYRFKFGLTNVGKHFKIDEKTTFNLYSVTKTFTALAVLQLAEQNKINLDHSVKAYLPDFPYPSDIIIKNLLSHTGGIPNPIPLSWIHLEYEHERFNRNQFFDQIFKKHDKVKSKPNEKFAYSNLGYVLLGRLIEKVSEISYEEYITTNIIRKLNLRENELGFTITIDSHAKGYQKRLSLTNLLLGLFLNKWKYMDKAEGIWKPFKTIYVNGVSYGGLIGTLDGLITYIQELLKTDCCLIDKDFMQQLFTEQYLINNKPSGMCLSWFTGVLNNQKYYCHAGGGGGYYCEIRLYPARGLGSVILFNRTGMSDERILNKVDQLLITN